MAIDAFLKIDGIAGESRDSKHAGEIDVLSYSFGAQNAGAASSGGGAAAGKSEFTDISFVTYQSKATVPLLLSVATGTQHKTALLTLRKASPTPIEYFTVTLDNVRVTSLHEGASSGDDRPTDAFSLTFSKITWSYREQLKDGSAGQPQTGSWDVQNNKTG